MLGNGRILSLVIALLAALLAAGCGGNQKSASHASVEAGEMPEGSEWTGVYYSQTYGHLHLIEEGGTISGKWRTTQGDAFGELAGEANGDLLRYEWSEHRIGMVGPSATTKGRGYFKYIGSPNGVDPDEIKGEWGLGEEESGHTWSAVKQKNVRPDPDSVVPDELERRGVGGGWDAQPGSQRGSEEGGFGGGEEEYEEEEEEEEPPSTGPDSEY
jgi:hypothetical protein